MKKPFLRKVNREKRLRLNYLRTIQKVKHIRSYEMRKTYITDRGTTVSVYSHL